MNASNLFLFCFGFGLFWALAALFFGSFHAHHGLHGMDIHPHGGHAASHDGFHGQKLWGEFLNIHSVAIFLAWFGGCGFLMMRHSRAELALVLLASAFGGIVAAFAMASFLHFLHKRERDLDPLDYDMVGVLGRVSSSIRSGGTGEILYSRDGARAAASARSENGEVIERGVEVVVTRYEKGVAYVRTWDSIAGSGPAPE